MDTISDIPLSSPTIKKTMIVQALDEKKINAVMDTTSNTVLRELLFKDLPKPNTKRTKLPISSAKPKPPASLLKLIRKYGLDQEHSGSEKAYLFIALCRQLNYTYATASKYFSILQRLEFFGKDNVIKPHPKVFTGKVHTRIVSVSNYKALFSHLHQSITKKNAPLLIAMYTGLRTMEILQFSTYTLYELKSRNPEINIRRKNTTSHINNNLINWNPVYNTHLTKFINLLCTLYNDEYKAFLENNINIKLFFETPTTLNTRFKLAYYMANNINAPHGFGIHSCRYMTSMLLNEANASLPAIQKFLQHKSLETTKTYMQAQYSFTVNEINRLTRKEFSNISFTQNE